MTYQASPVVYMTEGTYLVNNLSDCVINPEIEDPSDQWVSQGVPSNHC